MSSPHPPAGPPPETSELWSLAEALGVELPREKYLLHVVRAALKSPPPQGWLKIEQSDGTTYYWDTRTHQPHWFRPVKEEDKEAIREARLNPVTLSKASSLANSTVSSAYGTPRSQSPVRALHGRAQSNVTVQARAPIQVPNPALNSFSLPSSGNSTPHGSNRYAHHSARGSFSENVQTLVSNVKTSLAAFKAIIRIQTVFRKKKEKVKQIIQDKLAIQKNKTDQEMLLRLKEGKRRSCPSGVDFTAILAAANEAKAAEAQSSTNTSTQPRKAGLTLTVPTNGSNDALASSTSVPVSPKSLDGLSPEEAEAEKRRRKRATMLRVQSIQARFLNESESKQPEAQPPQSQPVSAAPAVDQADSRANLRLVSRRRSFIDSSSSSTSSSSSHDTHGKPTTSHLSIPNNMKFNITSSTAPSSKRSSFTFSQAQLMVAQMQSNPRTMYLIVRLQRLFRAHREKIKQRLSLKMQQIKEKQSKQQDQLLSRATFDQKKFKRMSQALNFQLKDEAAPARS